MTEVVNEKKISAVETKISVVNTDNLEERALLLVKGIRDNASKEEAANYVKGLASAILTVIKKYNVAYLRCIGRASMSNAVYAHAQANIELAKQGLVSVAIPTYKTVSLDGVGERTAIVMELSILEEEVDGNK